MRSQHRFRTRTAALTVSTALAAATALVGAPAAGALPKIPDLSEQYWFGNMRIGQVWNLGDTGQGMTVAVLDTGVQAAQPELAGVVLPGTDFAGGDGRTDTDTKTGNGHGTSMARLIAGQGGGPRNLTGIAPSARILPVTIDNELSPTDFAATVTKGIRYAADHRARIISLSQGSPSVSAPNNCPSEVAAAVAYAIGKGSVVVAAAGNNGDSGNAPNYPAACPGVLAVGAVDGSKRPWVSTPRHSYIDVASAGVDMVDRTLNGDPAHSDGTSNAAALVSGALALVWSKLPKLTNRQVVARILASVTDDAATPGRDDVTGYGIVRPYFAITDKIPANAPNPVFDEIKSTAPSGSPSATSSGPAGSSPTAPGATTPGSGPHAADSGSSSIGLYLGLAGAVVLIAALVIVLLVVRGRRGPGASGGYPGPPAGPPGSGW